MFLAICAFVVGGCGPSMGGAGADADGETSAAGSDNDGSADSADDGGATDGGGGGDGSLPPLPKGELPDDWAPCGGDLGVRQCGIHPVSQTVECSADAPVWLEDAAGGVTLGIEMADAACVVVELELVDAEGLLFNLGNSPTNNGGGGDAGSNSNDSEAWLAGARLGVAHSDRIPYNGYVVDENPAIDVSADTVEVRVCDGYIQFRSGLLEIERAHDYIFQIDGDEPDEQAGGENDTVLWLGLNRMISDGRFGAGVEDVCLTVE